MWWPLLMLACTRTGEVTPPPHVDPEAAARAFPLYYRERTDRVLLAFNRFGVFGDLDFAVVNGRVDVARTGSDYELVPGPNDNNLIGTSVLAVWHAWTVFRTRELELTLIRLLNGLVFVEQVSGHPGLTVREALPGWTWTVDGVAGTQTRLRAGAEPGYTGAWPSLADEVLAAFYQDVRFTYREDPGETFWTHLPAAAMGDYIVTHSQPGDGFLRVSDCCSSFMHTPDGYDWGGAYWGNHNSRDNFPDLALGYIAARLAAASPDVPADLRAAAERALASGRAVGDLTQANGSVLLTVDEHHDYDTLTPGGQVRPHGLSEDGDLGTLSACPQVFLAQAISTAGLDYPVAPIPMAASLDQLIRDAAPGLIDCPDVPASCRTLGEAFCGHTWGEVGQIEVLGQPLFDVARSLEAANPGSAAGLLGAVQNDVDDVVEAMVGVAHAARADGKAELQTEAKAQVADLTQLLRDFADILYTQTAPDERASQRYEAAVFDALVGNNADLADLGTFDREDARLAAIEGLLTLGDTAPWALFDDAGIQAIADQALLNLGDHPSGRSDAIRARYAAAFGGEPPVRRAGDAYEARSTERDWAPVPVPHHQRTGGLELWQALPICASRPDILDCTWAARGCAPADLDHSGVVDEDDLSAVQTCADCDVDGSGVVDADDVAYVTAAVGCWYEL